MLRVLSGSGNFELQMCVLQLLPDTVRRSRSIYVQRFL